MISRIKSIEKPINKRVQELLNQMTLKEKIGQMNLYNGFISTTGPTTEKDADKTLKFEHIKKGWVGAMLNVFTKEEVIEVQQLAVNESRLGIPLLLGFDLIHGFKKMNPIPLAESASWDIEAIKESARSMSSEAYKYGLNWAFAPMVDVSRDSRWGRVMEGAGEDPYLGSAIAKARVEGIQQEGLAACAKHIAGYGFVEAGKEYNTTEINQTTLFNQILPPFKAAIDAGSKTMMSSFNDINGVPATGNKKIQRKILKEQYGFEGFIVSDWNSINEMVVWGIAKNKIDAAEIAIEAGCDMDMESYNYIHSIETLVSLGKIKESLIDDAVKRILKVKFELGLFDNPFKFLDQSDDKFVLKRRENNTSIEMALKSIVLLKNEKEILPLKKEGLNIAVIGELADDKTSPLGSWRGVSEDNSAISVLEGLEQYSGNEITYSKGVRLNDNRAKFVFELEINNTDKEGIEEAKQLAENADVVLMVLGENGFQSGEGRSRTNLDLPGLQQHLLEEIYDVNQNIVLVLQNGRPLTIEWADKHIPAIVEAWHLGTESGNAIAKILYGDYNPSGKLPMTFPRNVGQIPIYYNRKNTGRPNQLIDNPKLVFWSHYSDIENTPLYPFGHGLSYTQFEYSNLTIEDGRKHKLNKEIIVSVDVKNIGSRKGKEVVQLYIQDLVASISRPIKELKGFEIVELKPNESKTVKLKLTSKELGFYNQNEEYVVEPGEFKVFVGGSSETILETTFELV